MCNSVLRYNWFETNLASFMGKYPLPAYYDGEDLLAFIRQYKGEYMSDFTELLINGPIRGYSDSIYQRIAEQKDCIDAAFDTVIEILESVNNSQYSNAENKIDQLLKDVENDFCVTNINNFKMFNPELYRIRSHIDRPDNDVCLLDLFHIPYSKRYLVKNERFSISGQPCLYLATSLNIAWKECGLPSSFYYSKYSFDYKKDEADQWKFLSFINPRDIRNDFLVAPTFENEDFAVDFICKYLRSFPIIMACSIVSMKKDFPFKPEYVFPQLIMQWIQRNIERIKGVMYFSCVYDDDIRQYAGYNIALPATDFNECGYSKPLLERFQISTPVFESNALPERVSKQFSDLFERVQKFQCVHHEMSDCWLKMFKLSHAICTMIKETQNTPSNILLILASSINDNTREFFARYNIDKIISDCRSSPIHQDRYDENIEAFHLLYLDFFKLTEILDRYYLKLEHGFAGIEI